MLSVAGIAVPGGRSLSMEGRPDLPAALALFLADLELAGRSNTARTYRQYLRFPQDAALDARAFREVMVSAAQRQLAPGSLATVRTALRSFGRYCQEQGWLMENPARMLPAVKVPEPEGRYLTPQQVRHIWQVAGERGKNRRPDELRLILLLLLEGLRASELCALRWTDIEGDRLRILGKGKKRRVVALSPLAGQYLASRQRTGPKVFDLTPWALWARIKRLGERAGIDLHPHLFRHTWASRALLEGADMEHVRVLGGWSARSEAVERYVKAVRQEAALKASRRLRLVERVLEE